MAQFNDPAAYERYMGSWSRAAGEPFLDWLAQPCGLRWLDNGCGRGVFSELLWQQAQPTTLDGIDISPEQLIHARQRLSQAVTLHHGDANALPFADNSFDVATMALVIVFLGDAARGVREMRRVVRSGGMVATYIWDLPHGFPYADAFAALSADMQAAVRAALQKRLPAAPDGSILVTARAHAAKGIRA